MASIVVRAGWSGLIRMVSGRLREVGSSMSCVSCVWFGKVSIEFLGKDISTSSFNIFKKKSPLVFVWIFVN